MTQASGDNGKERRQGYVDIISLMGEYKEDLKEDIREIKVDLKEIKDDIYPRINSIERWRAWTTGAGATIIAGGTAFWAAIKFWKGQQ